MSSNLQTPPLQVTFLGLSGNQLSGPLPPSLGTAMLSGALITLDNLPLLQGTLPATLSGESVTVAGDMGA